MDDLMAKLQEILSTSEGQENLKQIAGILGGQEDQSAPDLSAISSLLGQNGNTQSSGQAKEGGGLDLGGLDIGALMKMQSIMQSMKTDDKNTALIRALKPHLKESRQHRADEALRLMQLMAILPALRDSGILGNLFGGE